MSTYVYIKKSNDESNSVLNQIALINQYEVDELFIEEDKSVKELERLITKLADKDVLVLDNLAVIELSRYDMAKFFQSLKDRSIRLISVKDKVDTNKIENTNFINNCLVFFNAELKMRSKLKENNLYIEKDIGRPKISTDVVEQIIYLRENEKRSIRSIANECNVSIGTVHKYVKDHQ